MKQIPLHTGDRFGKLSVVNLHHTRTYIRPNNQPQILEYYLCICDCGRTKIVQKSSLTRGLCKSCGCLEYATQLKNLNLPKRQP